MIDASTQVRVRFVTNLQQYRVSDAPFVLPAKLTRSGLNQVVNKLLDREDPEELVQFDFTIDQKLLKGPLYKFILTNGVSVEDIIEIQYFQAAKLDTPQKSSELSSWLSSLAPAPCNKQEIAGCYDGFLRFFSSHDMTMVSEQKIHEDPISDVAVWQNTQNNEHFLATASKDCTVSIFHLGKHGKEAKYSLNQRAEIRGGGGGVAGAVGGGVGGASVETLCALSENLLLCGDWNGGLFGYDVSSIYEAGAVEGSKKRMKTSETSKHAATLATLSTPSVALKGHHQNVSCLVAAGPGTVYSASWDHSVRLWDVERQESVFSINTGKVATCVAPSDHSVSVLLACSSTDGVVRLYDEKERGSPRITMNGEEGMWMSKIAWLSSTHLASTSYSGALSLWDIRYPVKAVKTHADTHDGKVLCMRVARSSDGAENAALGVFTGGTDCVLCHTPVTV